MRNFRQKTKSVSRVIIISFVHKVDILADFVGAVSVFRLQICITRPTMIYVAVKWKLVELRCKKREFGGSRGC